MNSAIHSVYFSDKKEPTKPHHHDCHQLLFIVKGNAEIEANNEKVIAMPGSIAIFNRYEKHSVSAVSEEYERYVLTINPLSNYSEHKEYALLLNRPSGFCNIIDVSGRKHKIRQLFSEIIEEAGNEDDYSEEMQHSLINQLLITICRSNPANFPSLQSQKFDMIFEIQKMFEYNYKYQYSLKELSEKYSVSPSTLTHTFKEVTGYSVFEYLYSCRMASAKYFLAGSDLSIGAIVEKCGFSDNSNFSRSFKKLYGITPMEYRKKQNNHIEE